jgi:hypothetical protein
MRSGPVFCVGLAVTCSILLLGESLGPKGGSWRGRDSLGMSARGGWVGKECGGWVGKECGGWGGISFYSRVVSTPGVRFGCGGWSGISFYSRVVSTPGMQFGCFLLWVN